MYCLFFFFNKLKVYDNPLPSKSIGGFFSQKHYLFSLCLFNISVLLTGFPGGSEGKASACNAGDPGGKIPWRRKWQPTPVILPGKIPWTEKPGRLQFMQLQRVGHN